MSDAPRILRPADWHEQPWRNGGGVTYEIAAAHEGEMLLWRLSTALVERDGAYSLFPGLTRISTAIEGVGINLHDTKTGAEIDIPPLVPKVLEGNALYEGRLKDGPIRHLNFIFDPARIVAEVQMLRDSGTDASPVLSGTRLIFCVTGTLDMQDVALQAHETMIGPADLVQPRPALGAVGVSVILNRI